MSKLTFEIKRKFFHVASLIHLLLYYIILKYFNSQTYALLYLTLVLIFFLTLEYFRLIKKKRIPLFSKVWRGEEKKKIGGEVYYILGMILALTFFDLQLAATAILMMALGDAVATLSGISFGRHKLTKTSTLEGSVVQLIINLAIGYSILTNWTIIISMSIAATLAEIFSFKLDDNLTIPVVAGLVGQIIINFFL